jgi:hypothetical protein
MSAATDPTPPRLSSSPTSGCIILGAIVTVFGGLIILYTVFFFLQKGAMKGFTSDHAAQIPVFEPSEAQKSQLQAKIFSLKAATSQGRQDRILLTSEDLNTWVATADLLKDFRGTTRIEAITIRGIETRMTQPIRKMPFSGEQRHLNALFIFQPELRRRTIAMKVRDIIPEVGIIPKRFIEVYDAMDMLRLDPDNPNIHPYIPKISRIYTEAGHVVIETGTPASDQSSPPN